MTVDTRERLSFWEAVGLIAGREIADQLRDWRILTPIAILTLFFPLLMNFTANKATSFVAQYGANVVADRLIPFLLMVVGFFPISISLVIALESFAGERERLSLEPLLATPLTDGQLYLGKMLASLLVPLGAAYLGIGVYLGGLALTVHWSPPPVLLAQVLMLTTMQALVMVSGAVVISSQTTSVRAANLLASFVIVPMSQLIIGESLIMFWAQYAVLWWIVFGLFIVAIVLGRMGLHLFNREELLGREIDVLSFKWAWRHVKASFLGSRSGFAGWYAGVIQTSLPRLWPSMVFMIVVLTGAYLLGVRMAGQYRIPADVLQVDAIKSDLLQQMRSFGLLSGRGWWMILANNLRAIGMASLVGIFTFGILGVILLMVPVGLIGFFAGNLSLAGFDALKYVAALVAPHGILEIPAAIIAGAAILHLGMSLVSPPAGESLGESWLTALAEWCRVSLGVVLPLLVAAAAIEVFVTPLVAAWLLGGG